MAAKTFRYKEALEEIEQIVHRLENEDPDVDELSAMVKRAMNLIAQCKEKLRSTGDEIQEALREV
jgi:exodeoxyribonuclease VII small subunit